MQNQRNKTCTWSDRTRGQARSQTSDTGGQTGHTRGDVVGQTTLLQGQAGRQPSGRKPEKHGQARRPPGGPAGGGHVGSGPRSAVRPRQPARSSQPRVRAHRRRARARHSQLGTGDPGGRSAALLRAPAGGPRRGRWRPQLAPPTGTHLRGHFWGGGFCPRPLGSTGWASESLWGNQGCLVSPPAAQPTTDPGGALRLWPDSPRRRAGNGRATCTEGPDEGCVWEAPPQLPPLLSTPHGGPWQLLLNRAGPNYPLAPTAPASLGPRLLEVWAGRG